MIFMLRPPTFRPGLEYTLRVFDGAALTPCHQTPISVYSLNLFLPPPSGPQKLQPTYQQTRQELSPFLYTLDRCYVCELEAQGHM